MTWIAKGDVVRRCDFDGNVVFARHVKGEATVVEAVDGGELQGFELCGDNPIRGDGYWSFGDRNGRSAWQLLRRPIRD